MTHRFREGKRAMQLNVAPTYDANARTAVISFSSEYPVERFAMGQMYREVLAHDAGAMNVARLSQTVNVIDTHNTDTIAAILGVVERAWVGDDKRGYAQIRLADTPEGERAAQLLQQNILRNVSFGYRILDWDEPDAQTLRVTQWEPFEISLLSTPADPSVGYARALETSAEFLERAKPDKPADHATSAKGDLIMTVADVSVVQNDAVLKQERARAVAIRKLCRENQVEDSTADQWIDSGASADSVGAQILSIIAERGRTNPQTPAQLGLTKKEQREYSLFRMLEACLTKDFSKAGFEVECSREVMQRMGKMAKDNTFHVPYDVLTRGGNAGQRDMNVATAAQGGHLVQTANTGFIPLLRNRSVAYRMGATQLPGLRDNVAIPKMTGGATFGWLANETAAAAESNPAFGQILMTPKTIGGYIELSRLLTLQSSPAAEMLAEEELAKGSAVAIDLGVLSGAGSSGAPLGITGTAGIGAFAGTSLGFAGLLNSQADLATANVTPVRPGYVTTPAIAELLAARVKFASTATPLWDGNMWDAKVLDVPAMTSNQMAAGTMLFGDWSTVVIGEWGNLQIDMNPYAGFQSGIVGLRVLYSCDVAVRYAGAFTLASTIT
jgi:HK97 family phage major capsid protein/HK97 family phage prohead protease